LNIADPNPETLDAEVIVQCSQVVMIQNPSYRVILTVGDPWNLKGFKICFRVRNPLLDFKFAPEWSDEGCFVVVHEDAVRFTSVEFLEKLLNLRSEGELG